MIKTSHNHSMRDRYHYDMKQCPAAAGWCQLDTQQDAPYFGVWVNPFTLEVLSFVEGDETHTRCESAPEFIDECRGWAAMDCFIGIDPGWNPERPRELFDALGLSELLH